jgi:hypothetical protein
VGSQGAIGVASKGVWVERISCHFAVLAVDECDVTNLESNLDRGERQKHWKILAGELYLV